MCDVKVIGKAHRCAPPNPNNHRVGTVVECKCSKQWVVKNNVYFPSASSYFSTFGEARKGCGDYKTWEPYTEKIVEVS